jgi:hypothetical protein
MKKYIKNSAFGWLDRFGFLFNGREGMATDDDNGFCSSGVMCAKKT